MPFIDDEELMSLQKQIDVSIEQKEDAEEEIEELKGAVEEHKKNSLITNIVFGVLAGLGIGASVFLYTSGVGGTSAKEVKLAREQILDSITNVQAKLAEEAEEAKEILDEEIPEGAEGASEGIKNALKDKIVYSVQVKAMSNNKYPAMSLALAGLVTEGDYFKYSIGIFDTVEEAHKLRKALGDMGFRDAFVASYVNGERKEIHKPE